MKQLSINFSVPILGTLFFLIISYSNFSQGTEKRATLVKPTPINAIKSSPREDVKKDKVNDSNVKESNIILKTGNKQDIDGKDISKKSSNIEESNFEPLPATGYTDPNYEKNILKSQEPPLNDGVSRKPMTLADYENERNKYPKNSVEYNQIQGKIDLLKSEK